MVINFRIREINQDTSKLVQTSTLIILKNYIYKKGYERGIEILNVNYNNTGPLCNCVKKEAMVDFYIKAHEEHPNTIIPQSSCIYLKYCHFT
jgi:hypothetical protein